MAFLTKSGRVGDVDDFLGDWFPGIGEVHIIESYPLAVKQFLAEAGNEEPEFLSEYLIPVLGEPNPNERLLSDMVEAIESCEREMAGLSGIGDLGKGSFFKKIGKALGVKKLEQAAHFVQREVKKEVKLTEKIARKYGPIILTVVGAVLAPFTGGASMAAATLLIAAQKMYQAKKAAEKAKKENNRQAGAMAADAAIQEAQTTQQVNDFYNKNQQWFIDQMGVTPDKWAQLTLTQKIDLINNGASGKAPVAPPLEPPPTAPWSDPTVTTPMTPLSPPPSEGAPPGPSGSVGPSMVPGPSDGGADFQFTPSGSGSRAPGSQAPVQPAEAGMFGGSSLMIPAAILVGAVIMSGGLTKGGRPGRRPRRNPVGKRRRGLGRGR
jgi:hypothetical protein